MTSFVFDVEADVYRVQRRPNHRHIVINDDYRGVRVLDPWTGREIARAAFAPGFAVDGVIDGWAFRADGCLAVAFNDGSPSASALSLEGAPSRDVAHPPWKVTSGMVYDWRGDVLWLKDPDGFAFAVVDRELSMRPKDPTEVLSENRAWRRACDQMRRASARGLRVESDRARALLVAGPAGAPDRVGSISWVGEPERMVPLPARLGRVASFGERFIVLTEYEAMLLDGDDNVAQRYPAPTGFHYVELDTLPAGEGRPPALVLAAAALDGRILTRFTVHSL